LKRICLIEDERPPWREVKNFLGGVNAELVVLSGAPPGDEVLGLDPNLIVANARAHHALLHRIRNIPVIVIKEGTPPVVLVREAGERNLVITGWPLRKEQFLEMTSRMLTIAPRKVFKSLIRIFRQGEDLGALGQSKDFSMSGMAFRSELKLRKGARITVSFSLPEDGRNLRLGAEVVRVALDDEKERVLYGARFQDVTSREAGLLSAFILC
jgi:hypothetical protein